jgi:hypothetical protein
MREWIDLELTILTPAFVSGADQNETEIRAATVRGLLRWWWRATVGHECNLAELVRREAQIFGSTSEGLKSPLQVIVRDISVNLMSRASKLPDSGQTYGWRRGTLQGNADVLPYMAYGPVRLLARDEKKPDGSAKESIFNDKKGKPFSDPRLMRPAISPGSKFAVRMGWCRDRLYQDQVDELAKAACAWVTLGGIGSRSRKGWGVLDGGVANASSSVLLDNVRTTWSRFQDQLLSNGQPLPERLPVFPQLAYRCLKFDTQSFDRWEQALGSISLKYKKLRPRGNSRWIAGEAAPRRASSLLVCLLREGDGKLRGAMCLLPCAHSEAVHGDSDLRTFIQQFERF